MCEPSPRWPQQLHLLSHSVSPATVSNQRISRAKRSSLNSPKIIKPNRIPFMKTRTWAGLHGRANHVCNVFNQFFAHIDHSAGARQAGPVPCWLWIFRSEDCSLASPPSIAFGSKHAGTNRRSLWAGTHESHVQLSCRPGDGSPHRKEEGYVAASLPSGVRWQILRN
jgi:hypothetical protein